jgi:hypothetical protein
MTASGPWYYKFSSRRWNVVTVSSTENFPGRRVKINVREYWQHTQDEEKQNQHRTQYVGHHYMQTNTNNINMPPTNNWR